MKKSGRIWGCGGSLDWVLSKCRLFLQYSAPSGVCNVYYRSLCFWTTAASFHVPCWIPTGHLAHGIGLNYRHTVHLLQTLLPVTHVTLCDRNYKIARSMLIFKYCNTLRNFWKFIFSD
jgi:hypothetical protein